MKMAPTQPNSRWFWTTVPTRHGDVDPIFWSQQLVQTSNLRALVSVHRDNNTLIVLHLVQRRTNSNLASMFSDVPLNSFVPIAGRDPIIFQEALQAVLQERCMGIYIFRNKDHWLAQCTGLPESSWTPNANTDFDYSGHKHAREPSAGDFFMQRKKSRNVSRVSAVVQSEEIPCCSKLKISSRKETSRNKKIIRKTTNVSSRKETTETTDKSEESISEGSEASSRTAASNDCLCSGIENSMFRTAPLANRTIAVPYQLDAALERPSTTTREEYADCERKGRSSGIPQMILDFVLGPSPQLASNPLPRKMPLVQCRPTCRNANFSKPPALEELPQNALKSRSKPESKPRLVGVSLMRTSGRSVLSRNLGSQLRRVLHFTMPAESVPAESVAIRDDSTTTKACRRLLDHISNEPQNQQIPESRGFGRSRMLHLRKPRNQVV